MQEFLICQCVNVPSDVRPVGSKVSYQRRFRNHLSAMLFSPYWSHPPYTDHFLESRHWSITSGQLTIWPHIELLPPFSLSLFLLCSVCCRANWTRSPAPRKKKGESEIDNSRRWAAFGLNYIPSFHPHISFRCSLPSSNVVAELRCRLILCPSFNLRWRGRTKNTKMEGQQNEGQ